MIHALKKRLYFAAADYFAFWAKFVLKRWKPRIIVITGSSGKTTALHLLEAQLGSKGIYTHHANSAIGIPFHILGMAPNVASRAHWPLRFMLAPFYAFKKVPKTNIYVVEADTDRPNEGRMLSRLLKPEATLWVSVSHTHSANFDPLVHSGAFKSLIKAIAFEFGYFIAEATRFVAVNADQTEILQELPRVKTDVTVYEAKADNIKTHLITPSQTTFEINNHTFVLPGLHPKDVGISLQLIVALMSYLNEPLDKDFSALTMPPGRLTALPGIKQTTLLDSSYNTGLGATNTILKFFDQYPSSNKWLVMGDILEQGSIEHDEHVKLAELITSMKLNHIVLIGPRTRKHTYPLLKQNAPTVPIVSFDSPKEVLDYLNENLQGSETILFKGGRFLEGVIEQLLNDPNDADKLPRRGQKWISRRQKWGLPK